jgi:phosphonate transport system substrate-binding protein
LFATVNANAIPDAVIFVMRLFSLRTTGITQNGSIPESLLAIVERIMQCILHCIMRIKRYYRIQDGWKAQISSKFGAGVNFALFMRMNRHWRELLHLQLPAIVLLILLGMFKTTIVHAVAQDEKDKVFTFGIVPQQSASRLAQDWGPLLQYISKKTGVELEFKTAPSINEFEKRFAQGDYDFAYMNPYHYVVASQSPGYRAIAKVANKKIKGVLVVRKDSGIRSLDQLSGATLAFPSPAAFAASLLTRAELLNRDIDIRAKYVNSHDSVYRNVAKGLVPAGGGIVRTFNLIEPSIHQELLVLWTTPGYTPHAFAVHPDVPAEITAKINLALIELGNEKEGTALLGKLGMKRLEVAQDADWNDVRQLNLQRLLDQEHTSVISH